MAKYQSAPYRNACKLSEHLLILTTKPTEDLRGVALLAREWRELEQMKREWRGLPRLSPASVRELMNAKRDAMRTIEATSSAPAYTEPD